MERNYVDHSSEKELNNRNHMWDDQYDTQTVYVYPAYTNRSTIRDKLEDGFEKTKSVASSGFKKIKSGSSVGIHWIKNKYYKTTHKNSY